MERAEAGFVSEQRAPGHGGATGQQNFDGRVEPDYRDSRVTQKFGRTWLGIGAPAERKHGGLGSFNGATQCCSKLISFKLAKSRFAVTFKELRDGDAGSNLDEFIEINETPAKLRGETRTNSAFAGAHEAGQGDDGSARRTTA